MKIGISLLRANPQFWRDIAVEAEQLGFDRLLVAPCARSADASPGKRRLAERLG
jgi:alkanesulfonate monooxygenase SsuD/methylene tetrahydromethanopterin reductase-like flavin-dependent oxidoreductase (luciferase family)